MIEGQKLKILHVLSQRPDSTGSGIYLQSIMREAADCGHENFMVAGIQSDPDAALEGVPQQQCRFIRFNGDDLPFLIPGMTDVMPYPSTRFLDLSANDIKNYKTVFSRVLVETVAKFKPDIIHSHHLWIVSSLVKRLFPDIPVVTTCHGTDLRQFQNCPHLRDEVLKGCSHLDAVMALSALQKADIEKTYRLPPERVIVTRAGYNATIFTFSEKPPPYPVQLVYAGKLVNAKGLPWLLKALKKVTTPEWQLHLVGGGSGKEKDACLHLAEKLGDRVLVHGQVPQFRLVAIFKQAHIFVLPSFFEGLPLVVLEALASGCRLIANDLPGVMEVVGNLKSDCITLVRTPRLKNMDQPYAEDLDDYQRNLVRALEIQISSVSANSRADFSSIGDRLTAFTWRGIFSKIQEIYFSVLHQKKSIKDMGNM